MRVFGIDTFIITITLKVYLDLYYTINSQADVCNSLNFVISQIFCELLPRLISNVGSIF